MVQTLRVYGVVLTAVAASASVGAFQQSAHVPSFAGRWLLESQPVPSEGRAPVCARGGTIKQTETEFKVTTDGIEQTYPLDGKPLVQTYRSPSGETSATNLTSSWA